LQARVSAVQPSLSKAFTLGLCSSKRFTTSTWFPKVATNKGVQEYCSQMILSVIYYYQFAVNCVDNYKKIKYNICHLVPLTKLPVYWLTHKHTLIHSLSPWYDNPKLLHCQYQSLPLGLPLMQFHSLTILSWSTL
jgi:hypothetical protein